ncbi:class I SAM-dependent methyltransferase [Bacillus sp. REN3]|uniref:class I SAM-dependent methyltransferase n=1 Tax=Bacillus sp. REN3 TaxID=2802440 RepID=UPI001AED1B3C|nr:class I SAM-dependent methyltransferase [Bacillus sp. REN3]
MFVTTAGRTNDEMVYQAREIAARLMVEYIPRKKRSIKAIQEMKQQDCLVIGKDRLELFPLGESEPFFFHPNSAMFRIKRLMKGETDPMIAAAKLEKGMSFLDCTLGLGADSIVASYVVGSKGIIKGIEARKALAFIVSDGLKTWDSGIESINHAMRNIEVVESVSLEYLKLQPDNSFDCVYFDPMFETTIVESDGIRRLSHFAAYEGISKEMIEQAHRVARRRVVLKDHFRSPRFARFNFKVIQRKSAKFHFGVIEKE